MGKKRICLDPGHYGEKYNLDIMNQRQSGN